MSAEWIKELCPEIADWQVEMIWEQWQSDLEKERNACTEKIFESVIDAARIEREECARLCEERAREYGYETDFYAHEHVMEAMTCAAKIRARR